MSTFYSEGRYRCEVTQQGMTKASTGTPQFVLKVNVLEKYIAPGVTEPEPNQYERTIYRAITDKTMEYLQRDLDTLHWEGTSLRQLDPRNEDCISLVGREIDCQCKHEPNQAGETRERWSIAWARQSSEIEGEGLSAAEYRSLDALFGRATKAAPAKPNGKPKPAAPATVKADAPPEVPFPTDDDLPF